jgi:hypothetical protein
MFDSQNNNRGSCNYLFQKISLMRLNSGGYNKGDYSDQPASANPAVTLALQYKQQFDEVSLILAFPAFLIVI